MPNSKLVSVIVPCFNYGHLLSNALDSLLDQTYKSIEIIVINDGSTDDTEKVVTRYKKKHPEKIRYYQHTNKGITFTRNKGVSLAKGQYILQLDADDWIDQNYIKETVSVAEKNNIDIVYTDVKLVSGEEIIEKEFEEFNIDKLKYQNYIHASSLIRKAVFLNIKYDKNLEGLGFEDWDVFLGACLEGKIAKKARNTFLYYRKHDNQVSRSDLITHKQTFEARIYIFNKYLNLYPDQMGSLKTLNKLFEKLKSDNRKVKQQVKVLEQKNLNKDNEIKKLKDKIILIETEIQQMRSSRLWKISNTPGRLKNKVSRTIQK